jgi:type II secretory pathway predicted ATPase ExeA
MFLERFGLNHNPFSLALDSRSIYRGRSYSKTLTYLQEGILADHRLLVLVAGSGMGKTTLLQELMLLLQHYGRVVFLSALEYDGRELFEYILTKYGLDAHGSDFASIRSCASQLLQSETSGSRSILIIDEAQALPAATLESLRLLANPTNPDANPLQIVVAGQPELSNKLSAPEMAEFRQRVALMAQLEPLDRSEFDAYLGARLYSAGCTDAALFDGGARKLLATWSKGVPARINTLCVNALIAADSAGADHVNALHVRRAIDLIDFRPKTLTDKFVRGLSRRPATLSALSLALLTVFIFMVLRGRPPQRPVRLARTSELHRSVADAGALNSSATTGAEESSYKAAAAGENQLAETNDAWTFASSASPSNAEIQDTKIVPPSPDPQEINPSGADALTKIREGDALAEEGRYREAIEAYKAAQALGADTQRISRRVKRARRAEATEARVLGIAVKKR